MDELNWPLMLGAGKIADMPAPRGHFMAALALHITNPKPILFFGTLFSIGVPACTSAGGVSRPTRPVLVTLIDANHCPGAVLYLFTELRKRASLIETGGKCMDTGDEGECALYDEKVTKTPTWKIKLALNKLAMTNVLGDKLGGASPPDGYEWGKTF